MKYKDSQGNWQTIVLNGFSGNYNDLTNLPDLTLKEDKSNKVTSISSSSTDTQYPSAKCVYDLIGNINTILATLTTPSSNNNGGGN